MTNARGRPNEFHETVQGLVPFWSEPMRARLEQRFDEIDPSALALTLALKAASQRIEDAAHRLIESLGFTPAAKLHVLLVIWMAGEPLAMTELSRRVLVSKTNLTNLVDALESDGYVRRLEHPADRRSVLVATTAAGRKTAESGFPWAAEMIAEAMQDISPTERRAFVRTLAKLAKGFSTASARNVPPISKGR
ncbi:MAG: MarR family winged helix-turn-helix transcriptional regulator [Vulcanimicrobiaceae bacterium]